jgi:hypothetical protein
MTSGKQLDRSPGGRSTLYSEATKLARDRLDAQDPSPQHYKEFAEAVAGTLRGYYTFFEEVSEPSDPMLIRHHMVQEMELLQHIRMAMLDDLNHYFADEKIRIILSSAERWAEVRNTCIDERDATWEAVRVDFRKAVWAAFDDLSNEQVLSERRQDSRTAAVQYLQDLAIRWTTLAEALSSVQDIESQESPA